MAQNDKPTVIALREIEEGLVTQDTMDSEERQAMRQQEVAQLEAEAALIEQRRGL